MVSGRQREFDKTEALSSAMQVFWKKGYLGASLSELCEAMGINKPSMYAAYGNKEALFLAATDYYIEHYAQPPLQLLHDEGALRPRLHAYILSVVREQCAGPSPRGCYISLCVAESASEGLPDKAREKVGVVRDFGESYLREFFSDEIQKGQLARANDPAVLAKTVITLLHGTASMARGGASLESLEPVIDSVLNALIFE